MISTDIKIDTKLWLPINILNTQSELNEIYQFEEIQSYYFEKIINEQYKPTQTEETTLYKGC